MNEDTGKVEIGCTMNVTEDHWQSIFGTKETEECEDVKE